jgi:hypothetical protein
MKRTMLALLAALSLVALPVQAGDFEDDLNTLWEVLWDERGGLNSLFKWDITKTHYYRITGDGPSVEAEHIERALREAAELTGLKLQPAPKEMDDEDLPIEYRFVKEHEIDDKTAAKRNFLNLRTLNLKKR